MKKTILSLLVILLPVLAFSQVTINEFLASNTITIADSAGSFDDWFELYNGGSTPVDITGWYLTDDPLNMTKYPVPPGPSNIISSGEFLLIWCDEDSTEGPLHANFKLSAVGEFIGVSDEASIVIDSITFGAQTADVSEGRNPDGGSTWVTFPTVAITPGYSNVPVSIDPMNNGISNLRVYPNPVTEGSLHFSAPFTGILMDNAGREVLQLNASLSADVSHLPAGLYFLFAPGGTRTKLNIIP